jgi:hypothetical protein
MAGELNNKVLLDFGLVFDGIPVVVPAWSQQLFSSLLLLV